MIEKKNGNVDSSIRSFEHERKEHSCKRLLKIIRFNWHARKKVQWIAFDRQTTTYMVTMHGLIRYNFVILQWRMNEMGEMNTFLCSFSFANSAWCDLTLPSEKDLNTNWLFISTNWKKSRISDLIPNGWLWNRLHTFYYSTTLLCECMTSIWFINYVKYMFKSIQKNNRIDRVVNRFYTQLSISYLRQYVYGVKRTHVQFVRYPYINVLNSLIE